MKDYLQISFLIIPLIASYLIYKSQGNKLIKIFELLAIIVLSFLSIGAAEHGSFWFVWISLAIICVLMIRRIYRADKLTLNKSPITTPLNEEVDYRQRVKENIKNLKAIKKNTFSELDKQLANRNNNVSNSKKNHITIKDGRKRRENLIPNGLSNNSDFRYIAFDYEDSKGVRSYREVDVRSFDGERIQAYCHLAQAMRTFITSRIIGDIITRPTGEVKSLSDWIKEMKSLSYKRGK
ncbi:TPA: hypothetical protein LLS51_000068 [Serratia marcescens]|nr:hypothetical protein [Serratia marcescens]